MAKETKEAKLVLLHMMSAHYSFTVLHINEVDIYLLPYCCFQREYAVCKDNVHRMVVFVFIFCYRTSISTNTMYDSVPSKPNSVYVTVKWVENKK